MPDSRKHRSAAQADRNLFAPEQIERLREATAHFSWLLTSGYPEHASLKLVGDRFELVARQREAVLRASCSDATRARQQEKSVEVESLAGQSIWIDGYNVLTTIEAALGGGLVIAARDGCFRDLASLRGTWRKVEETEPALELIGDLIADAEPREVVWVLDRPVSNSARLKRVIERSTKARNWPWRVELAADADRTLIESRAIVCSADRRVLDGAMSWFNLARTVVESRVAEAWVVPLGVEADE